MATAEQTRLGRVLDRIAIGTSVYRTRISDSNRSERNGNGRDEGLENAVAKLEEAADALWASLK